MAKLRTVREFDDAITAPHSGYTGAADYYERASAARVVHKIAVPTLILTAKDDPFVPFQSFDFAEIRDNPRICVVAPESGGHCSFISGSGGWERYWAEARIVEFCLQHANRTPVSPLIRYGEITVEDDSDPGSS